MKILRFRVENYRSVRAQTIELDALNLFIGANACGKSTILDAFRFLHEAAHDREFESAARSRGGLIHLAWKGEPFQAVNLRLALATDGGEFEWDIRLERRGYDFSVEERLTRDLEQSPPETLLAAKNGEGWWWSGEETRSVALRLEPTGCALTAASADASFPGGSVADFVRNWGFFDPNPFLLRHDSTAPESNGLDPYGRNLARTLHSLKNSSPEVFERIVSATRSVLGVPERLEIRENDGRFYFVQNEPGLKYPVHQIGASSGTLRLLALMVALHARSGTNLIGIEEPENYVHPAALSALMEHIRDMSEHIQFLITTHSPLLLDRLGQPEAVRVVRRNEDGTTVTPERDPESVRAALRASGFGLGEFYETKGFGSI